MESTVAEEQGSNREVVAEGSSRQTTDRRNTKRQRGRVRATSVLANAKSEIHQDASSRAAWPGWKVHDLTQGDLFESVSKEQESAEAIVVKRPGENPEERRAEGTIAKRPTTCEPKTNRFERQQPENGGPTSRCSNPKRPDGAAIVSAAEEKQTTGNARKLARKIRDAVEHVELLSICSDELILVCIQSPDTENRMSGGVGALTGVVPSGRPDQVLIRAA